MTTKVVLVKSGKSIDLEYGMFKLEKGKTYYDDGTTIFDVYIAEGIADGSLEATARRPDTIIVTYPESRRR
jgi:hypothetical protein